MDQNKWFIITDGTSSNYGKPGYVIAEECVSGALRVMVKERATRSQMMYMHPEQLKFISQGEWINYCKNYFERVNGVKDLSVSTEYVIISDKDRKDYGCPGYIQHIMSSPHGNRMTVRVYSPDDPDSIGRSHYLAPEQIESITYNVFHRMLDEIRGRQMIRRGIAASGGDQDGDVVKMRIKEYLNMDYEAVNEVLFSIRTTPKKVIYNRDNHTTTFLWEDDTTTVVRCSEDDEFTEYNGFTAALAKKIYGGTGAIRRTIEDTKSYQSCKKKKKTADPLENTMKDNLQESFKKFYGNLCNTAKKTPPIMGGDANGEDGR